MVDALGEHDGNVSIRGRTIISLQFADGIDALSEEEQELEALIESLNKTCKRYKMQISAEKTKLMTNIPNQMDGNQGEIRRKGQKDGYRYKLQVPHSMFQNQRFSQGLNKPLQFIPC